MTHQTSLRGRLAATFVALALAAAACADDDRDATSTEASTSDALSAEPAAAEAPADADTVESTTTEAQASDTEPEEPDEPATPPVDPDVWIATVDDARQMLNASMFERFNWLGNPSSDGWGTIAFEIESVEWAIAAFEDFDLALSDPPPELAEPTAAWSEWLRGQIAQDRSLKAGFENLGFPVDTLLAELPDGAVDSLYENYEFAENQQQRFCFDVAEAATAAGFALLDCTNSAQQALEEAAAPSGPGPVGTGVWPLPEPGLYIFDSLPRPFAIEITEPTDVRVGATEVEFFVEEAGYAPFFHVVAVEEIIDPTLLTANTAGSIAFDQMVPADDLSGWFAQTSLEFETGTSDMNGVEVPYWRLNDVEFTGGELPMYFWAPGTDQPHILTPGSVFWEVPHPDGGSLIVYANKVVEAPDDVPSTARLTIGEAFLQMLRFE